MHLVYILIRTIWYNMVYKYNIFLLSKQGVAIKEINKKSIFLLVSSTQTEKLK